MAYQGEGRPPDHRTLHPVGSFRHLLQRRLRSSRLPRITKWLTEIATQQCFGIAMDQIGAWLWRSRAFEVKPGIVWSRFKDGAASRVERRLVPLDLACPQDTEGPMEASVGDIRLARIDKRDLSLPSVNLERPHVLWRFAKAQAKLGPSLRQLGPFDGRTGAATSFPDFPASALSLPPADRVMSATSLLELARRVGSPAAGHISGVA
jgi:hypothetical protein